MDALDLTPGFKGICHIESVFTLSAVVTSAIADLHQQFGIVPKVLEILHGPSGESSMIFSRKFSGRLTPMSSKSRPPLSFCSPIFRAFFLVLPPIYFCMILPEL